METVFKIHRFWGYLSIVVNGLAGLYCLAAWRWHSLRGKPVWIVTIVAESAVLIQVLLGTIFCKLGDGRLRRVPKARAILIKVGRRRRKAPQRITEHGWRLAWHHAAELDTAIL